MVASLKILAHGSHNAENGLMGITLGKHATDGDDQSDKSHGEGIVNFQFSILKQVKPQSYHHIGTIGNRSVQIVIVGLVVQQVVNRQRHLCPVPQTSRQH